jgi:hypothetical protein
VCWKPRSSCWSFHLLREEFLSAPIHSPPLWFAVSVLQPHSPFPQWRGWAPPWGVGAVGVAALNACVRPRAGRTLERYATRSRGSEPSSGCGTTRGRIRSSNGAEPARGGVRPRARRSPLEGTSKGVVSVGRLSPAAWAMPCMVSYLHC